MSRIITWLHLSDLHSGNPTDWESPQVTDTLLEDLKLLQNSQSLVPDFIVFTGDIAFGQLLTTDATLMPAQYDNAERFFKSVRGTFGPSKGIALENLFLVPGNHDVNRKNVQESDIDYLDKQVDPYKVNYIMKENGEQWRRFASRLSEYKTFLAKYNYIHLLDDADRLTYSCIRNVNGCKIAIAGFNSAWSCSRNDEKGKLWLSGNWQFSMVREHTKDADVSILLMHHPVNWFNEHEDPTVSNIIENNFTFFLHGHEHDSWIDEKANGHIRIAAAASYDRKDRDNGYNFVRLNLDTGEGMVWLREYDRKVGTWKPRVIPNRTNSEGIWPLNNWASFRGKSGAGSVILSPGGSLSPRIVTTDPHPIHRKVFLSRPPIGRDEDRGEAIALLRGNRILLLYGPPGQGKTMLAKYIAETLDKEYVFSDGLFEVDLQNERQIENVSKQIGSAFGDPDTASPLSLLASKKSLIILDSFESILRNNDKEQIKRFLDSLFDSLSGGSKIIITSQDFFDTAGLVPKPVRVLNREHAINLFHQESNAFYKSEPEERIADFVIGMLGGHALTIKIVARYSYHVAKVDLGVLSRLWQEKFGAIAEYTYSLDDKALTTSFELSYSTLDDEAQHFFLAMSLLPDGILGDSVKEIWGDRETAAYKAFATLEDRSLLESEDRLRKMLGPIFLYAQDKRRSVENDRSHRLYGMLTESINAIDRFYSDFVQTYAPQVSDKDPRAKSRLIHEHFHNIHSFLDRRIEPSTKSMTLAAAECVLRLYWAYHNNLSGYKNVISSAEDAVYYFDKAANVFRINNQIEKVMRCRYYSGNILWLRGEIDKARPYFDEVINSDQSSSEIKYETNRAYAHFEYKIGSIPEAVKRYEQCIQDSYTTGDSEFRLRCRTGLLDAYRKLEDFDKAAECFELAITEAQDVHPSVRGNIIRGFAYVLLGQRDLEKAKMKYLEALEIFKNVSLFGEAHCRRGLGDVYVRLRQFDEAQHEFNLAERLYDEARKNPSLGVGLVTLGRGRLSLARRDQRTALIYFRQAADLFSPKNLNEPFELAQAHELIGDALRLSVDVEGAAGYYQLALKQYERTGCDKATARVAQIIARIKTALGQD